MDNYSTQIEIERNRVVLIEEQIESLRDKIWGHRRSMGGVNAARENQRLVEKQVRILENRLDQALVKYNKSVAQNKKIRGEIDDLRGERLAFENVYKKLEKVGNKISVVSLMHHFAALRVFMISTIHYL